MTTQTDSRRSGVGGATTTYGYDWAGNRVSQTSTTTTYLYPFKWYSVASSTGSGAKYATTTDYVLNGYTLLATVDQQTASGNATGTAKTRYVHPDHLGSTNVVTDENDAVVQTLDYYPYGATRTSVGRVNALWPTGGRDDEPDTLALLGSLLVDLPERRLRAVTIPVPALSSPNRIPARLVLKMIVSPADGELLFCPDNLGSDDKARRLDRLDCFPGAQVCAPGVNDVPCE
jgi:hypothetical protein